MTLFKDCSQNFDPSKNMAAMGGTFFTVCTSKKFFKILLLWNCLSDFEIISQEYSLGDPFKKLLAKFWSIHKHGSDEWGLLALYGHEKILKKSLKNLLWIHWSNFEIISKEFSLGDPYQKVFLKVWSVNMYGSFSLEESGICLEKWLILLPISAYAGWHGP